MISRRSAPCTSCRQLSTRHQFLNISEEVQDAVQSKKAVVALETTIYTHGIWTNRNKVLDGYLIVRQVFRTLRT